MVKGKVGVKLVYFLVNQCQCNRKCNSMVNIEHIKPYKGRRRQKKMDVQHFPRKYLQVFFVFGKYKV